MTLQIWTVYLVTATILTMTPGLDTATVLRTSATGGVAHGTLAALGIGLGCLCWGSAAAFGLGALLVACPLAFATLKLAGAGYLAWLGLNLLLRPRSRLEPGDATNGSPREGLLAFRRGFLTNILNPKVGIFYITLLPQFVPHGADTIRYSLELAFAHVMLAIVWFVLVAGATGAIRPYLRKPRIVKLLDRATGGAFVGFGLQLTLGG
jgi:threonine/homoserine/homoserine lactone efflux protein